MPSIYINTAKQESAVRDTLVEKVYAAVAAVIKGPDIYTYVNEVDALYKNGKIWQEAAMTVVNVEAGPMPVDKIEVIGAGVAEAVKAAQGEAQGATMVYHANGLDHISINGKLIKK